MTVIDLDVSLDDNNNDEKNVDKDKDELTERLFREANEMLQDDETELMSKLLYQTVLKPGVTTFEEAVATTIGYRLMQSQTQSSTSTQSSQSSSLFDSDTITKVIMDAFNSTEILEMNHTMSSAVREDVECICRRDPACETILETVLFFKGFAALVCHRASYRMWIQKKTTNKRNKRSFPALYLQSQASAAFGVDIHPAATIGAGILFDHGTGIVIGETATLGDGSTLLHGVTLGGTGKQGGDRHPKVGRSVLIGAGASILGNVPIGDGAKIGAGSIVLGPIPPRATAVGAPAKIVGRVLEKNPGSFMDDTLKSVKYFHHRDPNNSDATSITESETETATSTSGESDDENESATKPEDVDVPNYDVGNNNADDTNSDGDDPDASACVCPFREYQELAKTAPPNTITICTLYAKLKPYKCEVGAVGTVFFECDKNQVGYLKCNDCTRKRLEKAILQYITSISSELANEIAMSLTFNNNNEMGLSDKNETENDNSTPITPTTNAAMTATSAEDALASAASF